MMSSGTKTVDKMADEQHQISTKPMFPQLRKMNTQKARGIEALAGGV